MYVLKRISEAVKDALNLSEGAMYIKPPVVVYKAPTVPSFEEAYLILNKVSLELASVQIPVKFVPEEIGLAFELITVVE